MRIQIAVATLFCVSSISYSAVAAVTTGDEEEVRKLIVAMAANSETVRQELQTIENSYEIVFIPGILGSMLHIGDFTYGDDKLTADKLVYNAGLKVTPDQEVPCETLNQFNLRTKNGARYWTTDVYRGALDLLKAANGGRNPLEYCYDWRADINESAKQLDKWLTKNLRNKKFSIVAHSMGGLVAWQWKNDHYQKWKDRRLVTLVIVGAPLEGSCEAIETIINGYGAFFERLAFSDTDAAILTFPSVFELLPKYDKWNPCMRIKQGKTALAHDHHESDTWLGRAGGNYKLKKAYATRANLSFETYKERVKQAIRVGSEFRQNFENVPADPGGEIVNLFYADQDQTGSEYTVTPEGENWLSVRERKTVNGDGRVSSRSAMNSGKRGRSGIVIALKNKHGDLLSDSTFVSFVNDNLGPMIDAAKKTETLAYASKDPSLAAELRQRGWFWNPTAILRPLLQIPELSAAKDALVSYNYTMALSDSKFSESKLARGDPITFMLKAAEIAESSNDRKTAEALYETAIALNTESDRVPPTVLSKLGEWRLTEGKTAKAEGKDAEAKRKGTEASIYFETSLDPEWWDITETSKIYFRGNLYNKLGQSYELEGSPIQASRAYESAAKFGNFPAKERLDFLRDFTTGGGRL